MTKRTLHILIVALASAFAPVPSARADASPGAAPTNAVAPAVAAPPPIPARWQPGAYADVDLGILAFLRQGTGLAAGAKYGPFRAGLSYASFLSSGSLGGVPKGFDLRVNYLLGFNVAYFIARDTDDGLYVQLMLHLKQQGVTNRENGAHEDLGSVALGLELGYVWKVYRGLYVAPRVGALRYLDTPQPHNRPVQVGGRSYDNRRHHDWDTYFIPTLSLGYAW